MATATAQDDDLLIIADDSASDNVEDDIEFSFDFGEDSPKKEDTKIEESIKTEDTKIEETMKEDSSSLEVTPDIVIEEAVEMDSEKPKVEESTFEIVKDEVSNDMDLGINFDTPDTQSDALIVDEKKVETSDKDESFSFDLGAETETEKTTEIIGNDSGSGDDSSMNDILSATIAKLAARKEAIASDKAEKTTKEEELKVQIKDLQEQVSELESDMKLLDIETDKIIVNTQELENMKLDPVKEHNAKRAKK